MRTASVALLLIAFAAPASAAHKLEAGTKAYPLEGISKLLLDFSVGELSVEGDDGTDVRITVQVRCRRGSLEDCEDRASRVTIERTISDGRLKLKFEGIPKSDNHKMTVTALILVPRAVATRVEMGVGNLDVREMVGPLDLDLGVGELTARLEAEHYSDARVSSGVGDASIDAPGHVDDHGFIGRTVRWNGKGSNNVAAHVGVGDASVRLR
jgi:hypothetical protein